MSSSLTCWLIEALSTASLRNDDVGNRFLYVAHGVHASPTSGQKFLSGYRPQAGSLLLRLRPDGSSQRLQKIDLR